MTWRANPDRAEQLGYDEQAMRAVDEGAARFLRAARAVDVPAVVSFTVQTDGRLPPLLLLGGCCGTDRSHLRAIGAACLARPADRLSLNVEQ